MAVERLTHNPENWNVTAKQLQQPEFKERAAKTPNELLTAVGESYRYLLFPGRDGGRVVVRDLGKSGGPTGGGSGGLHLESAILKQLEAEGELITPERAITAETLTLVGKLFFDGYPQVKVSDLVSHFATRRHWPILQAPELLTAMLLEGCKRDLWCLLRFPESSPGAPAAKPTEFYQQDNSFSSWATRPCRAACQGSGLVDLHQAPRQTAWVAGRYRTPPRHRRPLG